MASFVASRTSRAARAARFGDDSHTPKANESDAPDTGLQSDIAALKKATLADAGPILLRLLKSVEFRNYAVEKRVASSGVNNGVFIVDTPTRPTSPITPESSEATTMGGGGGSTLLVREGPEGSGPFSTHSNLLGLEASTMDVDTDVPAYLKGLVMVESVVGGIQ